MFSFVRNLFLGNKFSENNLEPLKELHTGYTVGFGYMPQSDLSGRRFRVGDVNSYRFGDDTFLAYSLQHTGLVTPIQMIVELGEEDPYIALSQVVDANDQKQLFGREISTSDSIFLQDKIVLDIPASHRLNGWSSGTYHKVIDGTPGQFVRGHFQLAGGTLPEPWNFRYYLYVNDTSEYALEIENFEHGMCRISLTVFRPVTDIGQIRKPVGPAKEPVKQALRNLPEPAEILSGSYEPIAHEPPEPEQITHEPVVVKPQPPTVVLARETPLVEAKVEEPKRQTLASILPSLLPESNKTADFALPCPASVAGKLIEESQRSQIPLSQLVRRILGLSIHVDETVIIPFSLSQADIRQLSSKFGIDSHDTQRLKQFLLQEVALFTGEDEEVEETKKKERV